MHWSDIALCKQHLSDGLIGWHICAESLAGTRCRQALLDQGAVQQEV